MPSWPWSRRPPRSSGWPTTCCTAPPGRPRRTATSRTCSWRLRTGRRRRSRLLEATAVAGASAGATKLYWQTHRTNDRARRLYDRVAHHDGFLVYERDLP
ncbi:MAG: hypothetical protein R2702_03050 [Acidimicrobiales bacterium]